MKRCITLILVITILIPFAAIADQDILVSGSQQAYDNIEVLGSNILHHEAENGNRIYIYYILKNTGNRPIAVDNNHCSILFYDNNGRQYYEYKGGYYGTTDPSVNYYYMGFWPYYIEPGQCFYLITTIWGNSDKPTDKEAYQQICKAANYRLNITLVPWFDPNELYKYTHPNLSVSGKYKLHTEVYSSGKNETMMELTMRITNNTSQFVEDAEVVCIIKDDNGNPVAMARKTYYDVNLGTHQSKEITEDYMFFEELDFLTKYDFDIKNVELVAFVY